MKILQQPQTEIEYWYLIEALGGFIWRMEHDLGDGRISDSNNSIGKDIFEARSISGRLVKELEKFGVIHPSDTPKNEIGKELPPPPEGKIYYWSWYSKMKEQALKEEYEGLICSACPFSEGVEKFIGNGGSRIPCSKVNGAIFSLYVPFECFNISCKEWTVEGMRNTILVEHGKEALKNFFKKQKLLKEKFEKEQSA